jgi:hypothetical protein
LFQGRIPAFRPKNFGITPDIRKIVQNPLAEEKDCTRREVIAIQLKVLDGSASLHPDRRIDTPGLIYN